jgi:hypothetical protein
MAPARFLNYSHPMNYKKQFLKLNKAGTVSSAAFLVVLAGYAGSANGQGVEIRITPPAVVAAPVVVQDNYVYYPRYGIYYNRGRHQYAYMKGDTWINVPAPSDVSVEVLQASPSVDMDFHDSPARHHAATLRMYPRNWTRSGVHQDKKENLKPGPPDAKEKRSGQPHVSISTNTFSTEVFADRSGPSAANTRPVSTTATEQIPRITKLTNDAPEPPTNLRVVSGQ